MPFQAFATSLWGHRLCWAIIDRFQATLHGAENLPRKGGALLVGNHAFLGIDALPFASLLAVCTGRPPWFLADPALLRLRALRRPLRAMGALAGGADEADARLRAGELVVYYPGGADEAFKLSRDAYTLPWGPRTDLATIALRAGVPVVPFAGLGIDELFDVARRERHVGRRAFGSARYDLPVPERFSPRRLPLDFHLLPPIDATGDASDPAAVERMRRAAYEAVLAPLAERRARAGARF